ncbi:hypothetical protein CRM22_009154 [Opisthorchis felineus]|uniref:MD-2-related lipid-recognition domain-containing protein n=1 Tax=Opisthorchis felineus TaxID=147828 RepID=A0A4S2L8U1_OPIFE|nr:hypothetical protein CRM22_009154 [Opisthorchis felineus]
MIWWMQLLIIVVCGAILHLPEFVDAVDFADCGSTGAIVVSVDVFPCNNDPCTLVKGALTTFTVNFVAPSHHHIWKFHIDYYVMEL